MDGKQRPSNRTLGRIGYLTQQQQVATETTAATNTAVAACKPIKKTNHFAAYANLWLKTAHRYIDVGLLQNQHKTADRAPWHWAIP